MSHTTNELLHQIELTLARGQLQQAITLCEHARETDPENIHLLILLGKTEGMCGNYAKAVDYFNYATSLDPENTTANYFLGIALDNTGKRQKALQAFIRAMSTASTPSNYLQLATAFNHCGDASNARKCCAHLLASDPDNNSALKLLAQLHADTGNINESLECYNKLANSCPDDAGAHCDLGEQLLTARHCNKAAAAFRTALAIGENNSRAHRGLAYSLDNLGHLFDAETHYLRSLEIEPGSANTIAGLAYVYQRRGRYDEAFELLNPLIDSGIQNASVAYTYAWICGSFATCDKAIGYTRSVLERTDLDASNRAMLLFSLGKLLDAKGNYDEAFSCFSKGNDLRRKPINIQHTHDKFSRLIKFFTPDILATLPKAGHGHPGFIYIIGMPRSGTSLVEQILASHPLVHGGGELESISKEVNSLLNMEGLHDTYPECLSRITAETLDTMSSRIRENFHEVHRDIEFVTDKTPVNFIHLGFISLINPYARFVHCSRNPLDTCLSCYFQDFIGTAYGYTHDLETLGSYYKEYCRLMEHWENMFDDRILTIQYEDLVSNPEMEVKALLKHCTLAWHDDCLRFHDSRREVVTSSFTQVRKPIYSRSIDRHTNYEKYIIDLKNTLHSSSPSAPR